MFAMFFGFAQIKADVIPEGVMPKDRRQVGTGVTTSTTSTSSTSDTAAPTTTTTDSPTTSTDSPTTDSTSDTATTPSDSPTTTDSGSTTIPTTTAPSSSDVSSSSSEQASSSDVPSSVSVTTTDSAGNTVTSSIATSSLTPGSRTTSALVSTRTGSSSDIVLVGSSTINRSTLSKATTIISPLVTSSTERITTTSYWTSDGQVYSSVITTARVVASTTGTATATIEPSLQNGGGSGNSLTPKTKAIIGGVVGGVGGAILIGGLALVAWRLWGKKKREQLPQDDFLDSQNDSIRHEKSASGNTLGDYQNHAGPVNTASNF